jgi:hypothetical protein
MSHDEFDPTLEWDGWEYISKHEYDRLMALPPHPAEGEKTADARFSQPEGETK